MRWQDKLTKAERKHLRIVGNVTTLGGAKRTFKGQTEMRKTGGSEPCWECKDIARKLGLPV